MQSKLLNLGCGNRYHREWVNIDFRPRKSGIIKYDLRKGIPFPSNEFDAVYHSHVLEHFQKDAGQQFLAECYRVLKPRGVLRVVVPDLEEIVREYLTALELARMDSRQEHDNYRWIMLELYDQAVRTRTGGDMECYLRQAQVIDRPYVIQRIGLSALKHVPSQMTSSGIQETPSHNHNYVRSILWNYLTGIRQQARRGKEIALRLLLGKDYLALKIGRFRQSGEVHQWMYDSYSLSCLLDGCGFGDIVQRSASTSSIPGWANYHLDIDFNGTVCKPDSLYMEAIKL